MDTGLQHELLAFEEKIALAELEEAKAAERVRELKYQRARFQFEYFITSLRQQQEGSKSAG